MAGEGLPVQLATRVLGVSESGYYEFRGRGPSARDVRHVLLTDLIREVHVASRGTYGARRVHAEVLVEQRHRLGVQGDPPHLVVLVSFSTPTPLCRT
jgi:hypothetical protein